MSDLENQDSLAQIPSEVADEMVRRLFSDGDPTPDDRILFPGIGRGGLVDAVYRYCDRHHVDFPESVALETDAELVEQALDRFDTLPLSVIRADFLENLPDLRDFDYVISDPPVSRLFDISAEYREDLATRFDTISADKPGEDEDLYLAFFEQGLRVLAPEGRLVFLTPDFTNSRGHFSIPQLKQRLATFHIEDIDETPIESVYEENNLDFVITTVAHAEPDSEYATDVDFDGVQEALTVAYDIGVRDIMTQDPVSVYPSDDVHDVYLTLVRNGYDAAPIRDQDSNDCIGLVSRAELTGADTGTLSEGYVEDIDEERLISVNASFEQTLDRLRSRRFCLVGATDDVRGIVTRFDLNSIEVYFHLYAKFARFEIGLRNAIRDYELDWEEALMDGGIPWGDIKHRRKKYSQKPAVSQDVLDTLLLSDLVKIVENSTVSEELEFDQLETETRLSEINNLRGSVAHYQPLIHTLDIFSVTEQRTTGDFGDIYDGLAEYLRTLEDKHYA